jgi:hypothetical protein
MRFAPLLCVLLAACIGDAPAKDTTILDDTGSTTDDSDCIEVPWYPDADGDGWGYQEPGHVPDVVWACDRPAERGEGTADCDDADPNVYPGAPEIPANGTDEDCDGVDA